MEQAKTLRRQKALRALACLGLALLCLVVVLLTTQVRYRLNDDAAISNIAAGAYGTDTQYLVYVNVLLGWLLKPFYALFPGLNWFVILPLAGALCCFAYLGCVLLQKLGRWCGLCVYAVFLATMGFDFLQVFHYVQYAALFLAVGLVMMARHLGRIGAGTVVGGLLALVGSLLRFQQFIAVGGLAAAVLLWKFWKADKKQKLRAAAAVGALILVAFGCKGVDALAYARAPGWAAYLRFNAARTDISDFRLQYDESEDLAYLGYSDTDYEMLSLWNFYDPQVFPVEKVEQIARSLPEGDTLPGALAKSVRAGAAMLYGRPANILFAATLVGWLLVGKKKNWPALVGTLALLAAEVFYLQWRGRMPDTVSFSLVIAALLFCAMCYEEPKVKPGAVVAAGVVVLACSLPAYAGIAAAVADYWPSRTNRAAEFDAAVQDKDVLYLADVALFDAANGYDVWHARPKGYFSNIVYTGSWMMYAPPQQQVLADFGIENLYADSVGREDVVFLETVYAPLKEDYLQEHYGEDIQLKLLEKQKTLEKYRAVRAGDE